MRANPIISQGHWSDVHIVTQPPISISWARYPLRYHLHLEHCSVSHISRVIHHAVFYLAADLHSHNHTFYPRIVLGNILQYVFSSTISAQKLTLQTYSVGFSTILTMTALVCIPAFGPRFVILAWVSKVLTSIHHLLTYVSGSLVGGRRLVSLYRDRRPVCHDQLP